MCIMGNDRFSGFMVSRWWIFGTMLLSAGVSLIASFVLSVDAVELAKNPMASLSCDINSVISCGTVAQTWQASLLGFPNSFFGMICEPVVLTIAVAGLSNVHFKRWFLFTAQVVYLCGLIFAGWLFYQSAFVIGAFCPWCLLVTVGTVITFFTMLRYNIINNNLYFSPKIQNFAEKMVSWSIDFAISLFLVIGIIFTILFLHGSELFA